MFLIFIFNLCVGSIDNAAEQTGIKNGDTFLIYNVLLQQGENIIEITTNDGGRTTLVLTSESKGIAPIFLELEQNKAFSSLTTNAIIKHKTLAVTRYLLDIDGDKIIDIESDTNTHLLDFPAIGVYRPRVIVKTADNVLYASDNNFSEIVNILANPEAQSTTMPSINNKIHDLEDVDNYIYALTDTTIIKILKDDYTQTETINLAGVSSPQGFAVDNEGNIFIADIGADQVVKLLAAHNYQVDTSFILNTSGSEEGQLLSPRDVTLFSQGENLKVFVLDAGNNRIQLFDAIGRYIDQFDGSTTPQGKLNNPLNMIGAPNLIITDAGNNIVRQIVYNLSSKTEEGAQIAALSSMGKVSYSSNGIIVPDNVNKQLLYLFNDGALINALPMSQTSQIALAYEQNHQLVYQAQDAVHFKHLFIDKTPPEAAPKALAQRFVQAFLNGDEAIMREITSQRWIDRLKRQEIKATEVFTRLFTLSSDFCQLKHFL